MALGADQGEVPAMRPITIGVGFWNALLGTDYRVEEARGALERIGAVLEIVIDGLTRAGLAASADGLVEGLLAAAVAFDQRLPELWSGEGAPVPYPAACRPQAWSAAAAVVVARRAGVFGPLAEA